MHNPFGHLMISAPVQRRVLIVPFVALLVVVGGCENRKGPPRAAVSGRVTLDGQEIEQGSIAFKAIGANAGLAAGGPIQKGRYSISEIAALSSA